MPPIYDPDNPYLPPGSQNTQPQPPPPPPPPAPVDDSPVQNWSDSFAGAFAPAPEPAPPPPMPTPAQDYQSSGYDPLFAPTPAPSLPEPVYVTNEEYFSSPQTQLPGGWGTDPERQMQLFGNAMTAAISSGDIDTYNALLNEWSMVKSVYSTQGEGLNRQGFPDYFTTPAYAYLGQAETARGTVPQNLVVRSDVQQAIDDQQRQQFELQQLLMGGIGRHLGAEPGPPPMIPPVEDEMRQWHAYDAWQQYQEIRARMERQGVSPDRRGIYGEEVQSSTGPYYTTPIETPRPSGSAAGLITGLGGLPLDMAVQALANEVMPYVKVGVSRSVDGIQEFLNNLTPRPGGAQMSSSGEMRTYTNRGGGLGDLSASGIDAALSSDAARWTGRTGMTIGDYVFVKPGNATTAVLTRNLIALANGDPQGLFNLNPMGALPRELVQEYTGKQDLSGKQLEAEWTRQRFEKDHPWLYMLASLPLDPWNYIGGELLIAPYRAGKTKLLTDIPLNGVLSADELTLLKGINPSINDTRRMWRISNQYAEAFEHAGLSDQLSAAFAKRLGAMTYIDTMMLTDPQAAILRNRDALIDIAQRLGASDAELNRLGIVLRRDNQAFTRLMDDFSTVLTTQRGRSATRHARGSFDPTGVIGNSRRGRAATRNQADVWADDFDDLEQAGADASRRVEDLPPQPEVTTTFPTAQVDASPSSGYREQWPRATAYWEANPDMVVPTDRYDLRRDYDARGISSGQLSAMEQYGIYPSNRGDYNAIDAFQGLPPEMQTFREADRILANLPPTEAQGRTLRALKDEGKFLKEVLRFIVDNPTVMTKRNAGTLLESVIDLRDGGAAWMRNMRAGNAESLVTEMTGRAVDDLIAGYPTPTDPRATGFSEAMTRNAAEKEARKALAEQFVQLLSPKVDRFNGRFTQRGGVQRAIAAGENPNVMSVAETISFFRVLDMSNEVPARLKGLVHGLSQMSRYLDSKGNLSFVSALQEYGDLLDEFIGAMHDPALAIDDIDALYRKMHERVFSDTLVQQRLKQDAEWFVSRMSPGQRQETLDRVEQHKAMLLADPKIANRSAYINYIERVEPGWWEANRRTKPKRNRQQEIIERDAAWDAAWEQSTHAERDAWRASIPEGRVAPGRSAGGTTDGTFIPLNYTPDIIASLDDAALAQEIEALKRIIAGADPSKIANATVGDPLLEARAARELLEEELRVRKGTQNVPPSPPLDAPLTHENATDAARRDILDRAAQRVGVAEGETPFDDMRAAGAKAREIAGAENIMTEAEMRALPTGQPAQFTAFRGGAENPRLTRHSAPFLGREPEHAGRYMAGELMQGSIPKGNGLSVVDIDAKKVLNVSHSMDPIEQQDLMMELFEPSGNPFAPQSPLVTSYDEFIHKPTPEQVAFLRSAEGGGYDLVITAEGGGAFIALDPNVMRQRAFVHIEGSPAAPSVLDVRRGNRSFYNYVEETYQGLLQNGNVELDTLIPADLKRATEATTGFEMDENPTIWDFMEEWRQFNEAGGMTPKEMRRLNREADANVHINDYSDEYDELSSEHGDLIRRLAITDTKNPRYLGGAARKQAKARAQRMQDQILGIETAGKGGLSSYDTYGIVHPSAQVASQIAADVGRLTSWARGQVSDVLHARRVTKPIIEPGAFNWERIDWSANGPIFDRYMDSVFKWDNQPGTFSVKPTEATALSKQAYIAMRSEVMGMVLRKHMDQLFGAESWVVREGLDPMAEAELLFNRLADSTLSIDEIAAIDPFFTSSKSGMEALRMFRRHGPVLRDKWIAGAYNPYQSVGWLADFGILPTLRGGKYGNAELTQLFDLLTATKKPRGMNDRAWSMLQRFQDSIGTDRINEVRRSLRPDPTGPWLSGDPVFAQAVVDAETRLASVQAQYDALPPRAIESAKAAARREGQAAVDNAFEMARTIDASITEAQQRLNMIRGNSAGATSTRAQIRDELFALRNQRKQALADANRMKTELIERVTAAGDAAGEQVRSLGRDLKAARQELGDAKTGLNRTKEATPDAIDALLFPENHMKPVDPYKMVEEMTSDLAKLEADRIGFNPDHIPAGKAMMQTVKGNLVPLWMTIYPGYHLRNIAGNVMAQLLASVRSDMHVGPNPLRGNQRVLRALGIEGNGMTLPPFVEMGIGGGSLSDVDPVIAAGARKGSQRLIPKAMRGQFEGGRRNPLNYTPLRALNPLYVGGMKAGDAVEKYSKAVIWTQEYAWTYADTWRKGVAKAADLTQEQRDELLKAWGHVELTQAMEKVGITDSATKQALRAQMNGAIGAADWQAYRTTASVLRDYRMRNRFDTALDNVVPVHYWTTRNALFVGSTVFNKPGVAVAAMQGYDNLVEQNKDLPISQRGSLVKIPDEWIPFYGDDYYVRLTSLTNPAFFMAARLANPEKWDLSKTSLPDRLDSYAFLGPKNLWEAMGYRIGPQWDIAIRGANLSETTMKKAGWDNRAVDVFSRAVDGLNWLNSPTGNRNSLLPFMSVAQTNTKMQAMTEWFNTMIYGAPYSRAETAGFAREAADRWQAGDLSEAQYYVILQAIADGKFGEDDDYAAQVKREYGVVDYSGVDEDDQKRITKEQKQGTRPGFDELLLPEDQQLTESEIDAALGMVRDIVDSVTADRANMWALSAAGAAGAHFSDEQLNQTEQSNRYGPITTAVKLSKLGIGLDALPQAVGALTARQQFLQATQGMDGADIVLGMDMAGLKDAVQAQVTYTKIMRSDGRYAASNWMRENAPWLPGYWAAWDSPEEVRENLNRRDASLTKQWAGETRGEYWDRYSTMMDVRREKKADERAENVPFYNALTQIEAEYKRDIAAARGNPGALLAAEARKDQRTKELGPFPSGSGELPREGSAYYRATLGGDTSGLPARVAAGVQDGYYPEALRDVQRDAAQQGYLLDLLVEQLGLDPGSSKFQKDGHFDREAYQEAVNAVAETAPSAYAELYRQFMKEDSGLEPGPLTSKITADDFLNHTRGKEAWITDLYAQKSAEKDAIYAMPTETESDWDAKSRAISQWESTWRDSFGVQYKADEQHTANENAAYGMGINLVRDWFYTLTPADRATFKGQYPDAFDEEGKFNPKALTSEQVQAVVGQNGLRGSATGYGMDEEQYQFDQTTRDRQATTDHVYDLQNQFFDGEYLTPEQKASLDAINEYRDSHADLEAQAQEMRAMMGEGTPWKDVLAEADGELAAYINGRMDRTGEASRNGAYDAQDAWFRGLPVEDQQLLIDEGSSTFDRYGEPEQPPSGGAPTPSGGSSGSGGGSYGYTPSGGNVRVSGGGAFGNGSGGLGSGAGVIPRGVNLPPWVMQFLSRSNLSREQQDALLQLFITYYSTPRSMRHASGTRPKGARRHIPAA